MITVIIISLIALIGAVFVIYLRQHPPPEDVAPVLPANPHNVGLFDKPELSLFPDRHRSANQNEKLLERAKSGDLSALDEAQSTSNVKLYDEVLDTLNEWAAARQERLDDLVSHISKSTELRGNKQLAQHFYETWKAAPDRRSTTQMIHVAALSDDVETFGQAVERVLNLWRAGRLSWLSPAELAELVTSEYWVITPEARGGGLGFALKRKLMAAWRELSKDVRANSR